MKPYLILAFSGFVGGSVTICLNAYCLLALHRSSAPFCTPGWFSTWFPSYLVWVVLLIVGIAGFAKSSASKNSNKAQEPTT